MLSECFPDCEESPLFLQLHEKQHVWKTEKHLSHIHHHTQKKSLKTIPSQKLIRVQSSHNIGCHSSSRLHLKDHQKQRNFNPISRDQLFYFFVQNSKNKIKTAALPLLQLNKKCERQTCPPNCLMKTCPHITFQFSDAKTTISTSLLPKHQTPDPQITIKQEQMATLTVPYLHHQHHQHHQHHEPSTIQQQVEDQSDFEEKHSVYIHKSDENEDMKSTHFGGEHLTVQGHWHKPKSAVSMMSSMSDCDSVVMERSFMQTRITKLL